MANVLTVVIPVYNREHLITRTLVSLARQTAPTFDIILVDNNSSDNSLQVIQQWGANNSSTLQPITILCEKRAGACNARNTGLAHVTTPWVMFFDSDDEMLPEHIDRVLNGIRNHTNADILGWDTYHNKSIKPFSTEKILWNNLFEGNFATQRWAAKTELINHVGGWNANVFLWNDIELGARLLAQNPTIAKLHGKPTVQVYPQEVSISANVAGDYLERINAPLDSIYKLLPDDAKIWTDYIRAIVAGNTARGASPEIVNRAKESLNVILKRTPSRFHRALLLTVYNFRRLGGRGQNHILKHILHAAQFK